MIIITITNSIFTLLIILFGISELVKLRKKIKILKGEIEILKYKALFKSSRKTARDGSFKSKVIF